MRAHRTVLYARTSTDDKQDPAVQLHALREWAKGRGWRVVGEEVDQVTGDPARRRGDPPGLRRALASIQHRRAEVLAVFAADRLVRSPVGLLQLVARVQSLDGHVASLQDGADLDTTTDMGELFLFLRGWMSRMELRLLRARTVAGLNKARAEGKHLGRRIDESAPQPTTVAHLRNEGLSWKQIAARLCCHPSAARRALARLVETGGVEEPSLSVGEEVAA